MTKSDVERSKRKKNSLQDDPVTHGILRAVSLRRIRPGTKLGEDMLAQLFNSNRMHIRQVLAYLASLNIVTLLPNRGAFLARPTVEEAREIFAARRMIEPPTVAALISRIDDEDIALLRSYEKDGAAAAETADRWDMLSVTGNLHVLIARLAGNAVVAEMLEDLVLRTSLAIAEYEKHDAHDCSSHAHSDLIDLIAARDQQGAVALMLHHLHEMEARLNLDAPRPEQDLQAAFMSIEDEPRQARSGRTSSSH
jgi:DNA-binding GntR family transcriptional regulator